MNRKSNKNRVKAAPRRPVKKSPARPREAVRIYLAGPEVFLPDAREAGARKQRLCAQYGFQGVYPIDTDLDITGLSKREAGLRIGQYNENLIRTCPVVIANLTPFRGPSADVGTVYEVGFARALGCLVFGYSNISTPFHRRTLQWLGQAARPGRDHQFRDDHGMAVEDWNLMDNLMLDSGIAGSGGELFCNQIPNRERFTNLKGFEQCLQKLCAIFPPGRPGQRMRTRRAVASERRRKA